MKKEWNLSKLLLGFVLLYIAPDILYALYNIGYVTGVNIARLF